MILTQICQEIRKLQAWNLFILCSKILLSLLWLLRTSCLFDNVL